MNDLQPGSTPNPHTAPAGIGGLLLGGLLIIVIAAVLSLAAKLQGWFYLGPVLLLFGFGFWFWRTRRHFRGLLLQSLEQHLSQAAVLAQAHCHAAAIERFEQAAPLAVRLNDSAALAQVEAGLTAARHAEAAAVERLAFVLYGLHAGRDTALARIHAESVINLTGLTVHDEVLEALPSLKQLQRLHLRGKFITDKTLLFAAHARGLLELYLENTAITDEGLRRFRADAWTPDHPDREIALLQRAAALREQSANSDFAGDTPTAAAPPDSLPPEMNDLKFLHIEGAPITDAGLAHLAGFSALERLSLHKTKITSAGLQHLVGLKQLTLLSLDGPDIGDDAIAPIARLAALERLELYATAITGATLSQLAACSKLERLDLSRAPLAESAVEGLIQLKSLTHLQLKETPLSPGAVNHLRTHLLGVYIAV